MSPPNPLHKGWLAEMTEWCYRVRGGIDGITALVPNLSTATHQISSDERLEQGLREKHCPEKSEDRLVYELTLQFSSLWASA